MVFLFNPEDNSTFSTIIDLRHYITEHDQTKIFRFQNLLKLEYEPTEDDIIQKIEVGNVSMPLNSSLISGAQSLFGVKTELKFGKTIILTITIVASRSSN